MSGLAMPDQQVVVETSLDHPFEVKLRSPLVSGFEWQPRYDTSKLQLVARKKQPAKKGNFGGSGHETFKFKALSRGRLDVSFDLMRPWETDPVERRDYDIQVS